MFEHLCKAATQSHMAREAASHTGSQAIVYMILYMYVIYIYIYIYIHYTDYPPRLWRARAKPRKWGG